jgi:hypothetical protein
LSQPFVESSESAVAHLATCESYHAVDNSIACLYPPAHTRRLQDQKDELVVDAPSASVPPPRGDTTATSTSGLVSKRNVVDCHATPCTTVQRGVQTIHTGLNSSARLPVVVPGQHCSPRCPRLSLSSLLQTTEHRVLARLGSPPGRASPCCSSAHTGLCLAESARTDVLP